LVRLRNNLVAVATQRAYDEIRGRLKKIPVFRKTEVSQ